MTTVFWAVESARLIPHLLYSDDQHVLYLRLSYPAQSPGLLPAFCSLLQHRPTLLRPGEGKKGSKFAFIGPRLGLLLSVMYMHMYCTHAILQARCSALFASVREIVVTRPNCCSTTPINRLCRCHPAMLVSVPYFETQAGGLCVIIHSAPPITHARQQLCLDHALTSLRPQAESLLAMQ